MGRGECSGGFVLLDLVEQKVAEPRKGLEVRVLGRGCLGDERAILGRGPQHRRVQDDVARRRDDGGAVILDVHHQFGVLNVVRKGLTGLTLAAVLLGEDERLPMRVLDVIAPPNAKGAAADGLGERIEKPLDTPVK
jgi:hypothetical protein